ncbi:MAG: hypothetical protein ACPG4T_21940 [Nannocystaceae bacterium]
MDEGPLAIMGRGVCTYTQVTAAPIARAVAKHRRLKLQPTPASRPEDAMKTPLYKILVVAGLAGCSIVDNKRAEFEQGDGAGDDSSTDLTVDGSGSGSGEESGRPEPTTGSSTGLDTSTSNAETDSDTTAMPSDDTPTVDHFAVRSTVSEAGPLWINATISDATQTELEILRDGEPIDTLKNPKFPREIPITSGSFNGEYTFNLHAWSTSGVMASATETSIVDLPEGGTMQASWQEPSDLPSSAAAIVPVQPRKLGWRALSPRHQRQGVVAPLQRELRAGNRGSGMVRR